MSQRRYGLLIVVLSITCSLFSSLPAVAESNVRIVHLSYIDGDAQVDLTNQDAGFTHAVLNMPLMSGMWVYTPKGGRAEVQFENGSTVRLVDDAQIQFEKLALADSGGKINVINVDHGVVYFNFDKVNSNDQVTIKAGGKIFRITKSGRLRVDAAEKTVKVAVLRGEATLAGEPAVDIKSHETLSLAVATPGEYKVATGTDRLDADRWNKDRDNEVAVLSSRNDSDGYLSAYNSQFSSLGAYGNFYNVAGYGNVWQPFGMGAGWDPFSNGLWGFYPGIGNMFISSYPWGWAPYRYGQWNYLSTYGWVWAPGSTFTSYNVGPRVGAVPAGWRAPVQPAAGIKSTQLLVVGNPPNVHPAILAGRGLIGAHPDTRAVASESHVRGSVAAPGTRPQPGTLPRKTLASLHTEQHSSSPMRAGGALPVHSAPTASSSSGSGHPK
jgi:hypothetical protein